ncbi:MAG: hypothetical protein PHY15_00045 [Eubacteriales bacterium]|nr:hypothetical protein [Eubacteriales bacterium]MDD4475499.1 hypothetical protein [Eubacteriales bacterium]
MKILSSETFVQYKQSKQNRKGLSDNQVIQAKAEVFLSAYFFNLKNRKNMDISIDTDVKVNPFIKKDIDLQICQENIKLNIEVKTPEQDLKEKGKFYGGLPHRYSDIKRAEQNPDLRNISDMLKTQSGIEPQILKTNDNKVKDYIVGANEKFYKRNKESLNILAIMCTSEQMGNVLLYLINPHSGLITTNTYDSTIILSELDYIIVSNAIEGIVNKEEYTFYTDDLSNYVTLILSPHKDLTSESEVSQFLFSIMPNDNNKYCTFEKEYAAELRKGNIPDSIHYQFTWSGYLAKYHPEFALNKSKYVSP